ncbi:hypothetical protein CKM354_001036500 [Cercospora kikuchii]|uniref:Protein kinase domain-containing protein n=1 Tax=Cercospora kikuchii TaxID=84275 RepID=A0A9P3FH18_9PEZI|nr:uncharacterized protein CKM354_001036500 [Cercospora kikuchii]GIZ47268.1 hypothetical protein CKM354_001036500 [Cercospora kikuchii]
MTSGLFRHCRLPGLVTRWNPLTSKIQFSNHQVIRHFAALAAAQNQHEYDLFNYTSGRWLYNEKLRLAERHLTFEITALLEAAARSVNQSKKDIMSFRKLAEGGFNRVFEATMKDGFQVIARLPYPSTQPKLLATASEVATMDLVREYGVPTPMVYGYSTDADNDIGSEYILMEKAIGRCLGDVWYEISDEKRIKVLGEIVKQEAKLFGISFPAYGSVCYTADLPENMGRVSLEVEAGRFCVGPYVSLKYCFGTRSQLEIMRGPALTAQQVLGDGARKEIAWLRAHGKPRLPFGREYREMFGYEKVDPREHIASLEQFLTVAAYIVPKEEWLHKPVLRHPDLNPNNIFVDNDFNITSIIDWQHATILPLFLHAGVPDAFQNYGDPDSEELKKPELPSHLDELDEDDRQKDLELYRRQHTHFYYVGATATILNSHYRAMANDKGLFRKRLYQHAVEPWEGNSLPSKADLVMLANEWATFATTSGSEIDHKQEISTCPINFEEQDAEETIGKMIEQEDINRKMQILRDVIEISTDGWASHERYDDAAAEANHMKEMTDQHWPFDDFEEEGAS